MNKISKIDYPFDISIKMLYLAGKILQEQGNFERIPNWLVETMGINNAAMGIRMEKHFIVYFSQANREKEKGSMEVPVETLWCSRQDSFAHRDVPCLILDCPVRQEMVCRSKLPGLDIMCFPMSGRKGFLMVCGEALLLNSFPVSEILKAITHIVACSLDTINKNKKSASYFLPSEDMAQMWSEMLAGLSHDLRTPLSCIKGYITTLMREDVAWDPAAEKEFMNIIVEETDHIESLIDNLLDSSTFSWKGEMELKKELISIPQIVNKVLKDQSYRNKNHDFIVNFPKDFPLVEADSNRVEQVLRNLVDNSVKYSKEETKIEIKGKVTAIEVVVSVSDQGIGINSEHLKWLFEKFFRTTDGILENKKGIGLGLPLARQIILSHGGRIWAKSKVNHGTTLYFTLPTGKHTDEPDDYPQGGGEVQYET
ncbi:sensor histidine kinase [Pelotomaculum propionicicum]|uniref:sensor histidine kinase n=1 Tax=Pelotomaculum propionicicum TaxID=258475 RepID=UPI003B766A2A